MEGRNLKDIRIDDQQRQRCWNCGGINFTTQRTTRSKLFGLLCLLTKPKLRCVRCGEYNDPGNAKHYQGPASRKYAAEWQQEQATWGAFVGHPHELPGMWHQSDLSGGWADTQQP